MSAHTPGPWALQLAEECTGRKLDELVQWVVTANDHDLWISTGPTWDAEHSEESLANARLIAAAPELLEALAEMVDWYSKRRAFGSDEALPIEQQEEEIQRAMRAFAKAKGEQP